ncbi:unnamed protein product [Rotaria socialis]|uniref:Cystatin domain-containing protein n=1 Tax=Rotaria socialis TaxID=392032 RepID=A0A817ZRS2_9BILA|nr:unnamed protein product [Rotaria socialis]CAF3397953.1 unnamed protein product [Rotaria socialis]CAF3631207.1 unnamed protein product [Rotaria socialis]CAF3743273.1 unnamed protein product [Rotaria socialis]CAF3801806.1 unnamed protein product [Rotaria socialis]
MFKILIALSLLVVIQGQLAGGFTDRPDLLNDATTRVMVQLSVSELAKTTNLAVSLIKVVKVATQVVNGINYRIDFIARPLSSDAVLTCSTKIYQSFQGQRTVSSVGCV